MRLHLHNVARPAPEDNVPQRMAEERMAGEWPWRGRPVMVSQYFEQRQFMLIHTVFDILAWVAAFLAMTFVSRRYGLALPVSQAQKTNYYAWLIFGSGTGAYLFGTLNMLASGQEVVARSVEGAIFGGICAVELFKRAHGLRARTGARLAAPLAIGVAVGRIGCYLSGIEDFTYGVPTSLPWGHDFGDGISRHPVQLYESAAMFLFFFAYLAALARGNGFVARNGFYLAVGYYGAQRFLWEFLKPYGSVLGPFSVFHFLSLSLVAYAAFMLLEPRKAADERPGFA